MCFPVLKTCFSFDDNFQKFVAQKLLLLKIVLLVWNALQLKWL